MNPFLIIFSLLIFALTTQAQEPVSDSEIFAKRGKGVITQAAFTARAEQIPADLRLGALRDGGRLENVIATLLLNSQLAADAREAGYDKDQIVIDRMQLAAEAELARAWLQHYVDIQPAGDYEQLAREYYQLHKEEMLTAPKIDVSHILVSSKDRSPEEALELAESIRLQLDETPLKFDDLVEQYSDDPSAASNQGKFKNVKKGDMVKEFERVAFALKAGEISAPVRTTYGYHIIRLDAHIAAEQLSFDDVRQRLIDAERSKHDDRVRKYYLESLTILDVEMSEESLEEMINRLFGEGYNDPDSKAVDKE
jgi:parvulin-like peptidyl-prolyl isomerase